MFDIKELERICSEAVTIYGADKQMNKMQEEMNELGLEIARFPQDRSSLNNIAEESVDCFIMAYQMRSVVGPELFDKWLAFKMNRCDKRLDKYRIKVDNV